MRKAVVIIITFTVMVVIATIGAGYFSYCFHEKIASDRYLASVKAFYLAEAGIDKALASGATADFSEDFGQGRYTVNIESLGGLVYRIHSGAQVDDNQQRVLANRALSVYVKDTPFNLYSYLTDDEYFTQTYCFWRWCWTVQTPVWFITGDRLEGPISTNSDFHISGSPEFHGPVRSVADEITYMHGGPPEDNPYFDSAYSPNPNLGASSITLPAFNDSNLQDLAASGENFTGNTNLVCNDTGTMEVTNAQKGWVSHNMAIPASKGILVEGGNLYVSGTLNGEVTLAAAESTSGQGGSIVVTDNIRYSDRYDQGSLRTDPYLAPGSDDYLGMIAEKNIVISKNAPDNLEIDGSMMALGDSFIVERWWDSSYNKDTLMVLGGIIQQERGPVGTFSGSGKLSGYSKNYIYDTRLNSKSLPYFPTTGEYKIISWRKE